jgi:hypothetical protein
VTSPRLAQLSLWGASNAFHEGRAYRDPRDGKQYPSITTALKGVPKDLTQYAADQQLKWCIENWQFLGGRSDDSAFRGARYRWRDHADLRGNVGDGVHNYIEAEQTGSWDFPELDAEQEQILANWHELNEVHDIEPLRNEITVVNREVGYMGTFDSYCKIDGVPTMVDFKTSKGIYDTAYMQIAALCHGEHWLIEVEDMKWEAIEPEPIEAAAVFHLRADKWAIHWVNDIDLHWKKFVHYVGLYYLNEDLKRLEKERDTPKGNP